MINRRECLFTAEHEWIFVDGDVATIGITDYAQNKLGEIVYVDIPSINDEFAQDDIMASVESVKTASDIYAPISGKVISVNDVLEDEPELINDDPYENWIVKLRIQDDTELDNLMEYKDYKDFLGEEY